jgi:hypothetical protein
MSRMGDVKRHFEEEAREFDGIIRKLIPYGGAANLCYISGGRRNEFNI